MGEIITVTNDQPPNPLFEKNYLPMQVIFLHPTAEKKLRKYKPCLKFKFM